MIYLISKYAIAAAMLVAITELARRSSWAGAVLAALPLTSLLAFMWLYIDGQNPKEIGQLSLQIFWLVLASLPLFLLLPYFISRGWSFWLAFACAIAITNVIYAGASFIVYRFFNPS